MDIPAWGKWLGGVAAAVAVAWGFVKNVLEIRTKLASTRFGKWAVMLFTKGKRIRALEAQVASLTTEAAHPEVVAWRDSLLRMREFSAESTRLLDLARSREPAEVHGWFQTSVVLSTAITALMEEANLPLSVVTRYRQPQARASRPVPDCISLSNQDSAAFTLEFRRLCGMEVGLRDAEPALAKLIDQRGASKKP